MLLRWLKVEAARPYSLKVQGLVLCWSMLLAALESAVEFSIPQQQSEWPTIQPQGGWLYLKFLMQQEMRCRNPKIVETEEQH
jgi:hypothetical protein